jgi:hypothetical protein
MKSLIIAAALLAATCAPAMARCHGHVQADGHWDPNVDSWTNAERLEILRMRDQLKANGVNMDSADIAALVDQIDCLKQ